MKKIKSFNSFINENYSNLEEKQSYSKSYESAEKNKIKTGVIQKWKNTKMENILELQKFLKEYGTKVVDGKGGVKEITLSGKLDNPTSSAFWTFWWGTDTMKEKSKYPQPKTPTQVMEKLGKKDLTDTSWGMRKLAFNFIKSKNNFNPIPPFPAQPSILGGVSYYQKRKGDFTDRTDGKKTPPDYYLSYGDKYVHKFKEETRKKLSEKGKKWLDKTLLLLQEYIERILKSSPNSELNSTDFRKKCFDSHPDAYINAGLFNLGPEDLYQIAMTPEWRDILTPDGMAQILEIIKRWSVTKANEVLKQTFRVFDYAKGVFNSTVRTVEKELDSWYNSAIDAGKSIGKNIEDFVNWMLETEDLRKMENYTMI